MHAIHLRDETPIRLLSYIRLAPTNINFYLQQYDRSGRSSGVAVVVFETPAEATRAKKQFDGILCKSNIRPHLVNPALVASAS